MTSQCVCRRITVLLLAFAVGTAATWAGPPTSMPITEVLRQPLPPEDLDCTADTGRVVIHGPTFRYIVDRRNGAIAGLQAERAGRVVAKLIGPADIIVGDTPLSNCMDATTRVASEEKNKVVLITEGVLAANLRYTLTSTFYNDGVAVSEMTLHPDAGLTLRGGIRYRADTEGRFTHYLHKRRDTNGMDCFKGLLPETGQAGGLGGLSSCIEVLGHEAALAVFTDRAGMHRSAPDAATGDLEVQMRTEEQASVTMTQHLVHPGDGGFVLRAGEDLTFRVGLAIAPNREAHPRWRDLRMFIWVGDAKHPYPNDEEIRTAAHFGFNLFQMHRLGTPGEPRPPKGELERVLKTVHDAGMLFIWTANADLMYASAPGVVEKREAGAWTDWQGFNYSGAYRASMDPYCDLVATCLASPNGLADYRVETLHRMLDKYPVDGMYIDDNLPYANCTLWKEHGHPEPVYDCLIELHEMNWRRRQTLLSKCPHAVLIDHCSRGFILPAISAFDGHLFGEGYSFRSVEDFWDTFGTFQNMNAAGSLFAGDSEGQRCGAEIAYSFDLLTGGGQYCYLDWRLWPKKFPYAAGVSPDEPLFVKTYNLAQYYFGLYESTPHYFGRLGEGIATSAPNTYATIYENTTWDEALVVLANMGDAPVTSSVLLGGARIAPITGDSRCAVYDVNERRVRLANAGSVSRALENIKLDAFQMKLFTVRRAPMGAVYHQWGGKRISETWDAEARRLTAVLQGPPGLEDTVVFGTGGNGVSKVRANGAPAEFFEDDDSGLAFGTVTFGNEPITVEVICAPGEGGLPQRTITPDALTTEYFAKRKRGE